MSPKKIIVILAIALAFAMAALGIVIAARIAAKDSGADAAQIIASDLSYHVKEYRSMPETLRPAKSQNTPGTEGKKEHDDRDELELLKMRRMEVKRKPREEIKAEIEAEPEMIYAGTFSVCGYDTCAQCCGWSTGITASGTTATVGRTCASNDFPFGTILYIDGIGERVVEDRGGMSHGVLDVLCEDHPACYAITGSYDVWIVSVTE